VQKGIDEQMKKENLAFLGRLSSAHLKAPCSTVPPDVDSNENGIQIDASHGYQDWPARVVLFLLEPMMK